MISAYFGDPRSLQSTGVWVEVQPNAWIVDGGAFLLVSYAVALLVTCVTQAKIAMSRRTPALTAWAGPIFALGMGTVALAFSFTPFTAPIGLQYWFLAGLLHGAAEAEEVDGRLRPG
jgi:hypothetical protein